MALGIPILPFPSIKDIFKNFVSGVDVETSRRRDVVYVKTCQQRICQASKNS